EEGAEVAAAGGGVAVVDRVGVEVVVDADDQGPAREGAGGRRRLLVGLLDRRRVGRLDRLFVGGLVRGFGSVLGRVRAGHRLVVGLVDRLVRRADFGLLGGLGLRLLVRLLVGLGRGGLLYRRGLFAGRLLRRLAFGRLLLLRSLALEEGGEFG